MTSFFRLPLEGTYRYTKCVDALPGEGKLSAKQTDEVLVDISTSSGTSCHLPLKGKAEREYSPEYFPEKKKRRRK